MDGSDDMSDFFNSDRGSFAISLPVEEDNESEISSDPDLNEILLGLLIPETNVDVMPSSVVNLVEGSELLNTLQISDMEGLPRPEIPAASNQISTETAFNSDLEQRPLPPSKRFKSVSEDDIKHYEGQNQSVATKSNTRWALRTFEEWHLETYGVHITLHDVDKVSLAEKLLKFYLEAKPKPKASCETEDSEYHKNTLKNLRAAINRHLQDLGREIDIVHDKEFSKANRCLDGMLKARMRSGTSKPTMHKEIIENADLQKISEYFNQGDRNPIVLRQSVWFNLGVHFVSRGLEFHHQLNLQSFVFSVDQGGNEYVTLSHETKQKNFQGGLYSDEALVDKRMYATGLQNCPVALLRTLLEKTNPHASSLFNQCNKDALLNPTKNELWYTDKSLGKRSFTSFMPDICKGAKCSRRYTAHCLRATAIQALSNAGFETRQIMFMSGHRNEASVRSYSRGCSTHQKRSISQALSSVATGNDLNIRPSNTRFVPSSCAPTYDTEAHSTVEAPPVPTFPVTSNRPNNHNVSHNPQAFMSAVRSSTGLLSNSVFSNCVFNFQN